MADGPENWDEDTTAVGVVTDPLDPNQPRTRRACLTVLTGAATGHIHKLTRGLTLLGRAPQVEVKLPDEGVSRTHARVRVETNQMWLEDLESRNGTFLNGLRLTEPIALQEGDKIQIGRTTILRFAFHDELDESFHENLMSSALRDPLTKLFNKRYLMDRLDSELKFAKRHETSLSLLMLDIDHFKVFNDTHGHLAGDAVLANLASVLVRAVRNEDVVARFGGEELAVVLRSIPLDAAAALGERLRKTVEQTITEHNDHDLQATISVGVAGFPSTKAETVEQLIEAADQALYRAKHAGRNYVSR